MFSVTRQVGRKYKVFSLNLGFAAQSLTHFNYYLPSNTQTEGLLLKAPDGQLFRYGANGASLLAVSSEIPVSAALVSGINLY